VKRVIKRRYQGAMIGLQHDQNKQTLWLTNDHLVLSQRRVKALSEKGEWQDILPEHFARARQMRKEMTHPERLLWGRLRGGQLGVKFRRQHPIGPYITDFYTREAGLVVEVDGQTHFQSPEAIAYDQKRDSFMTSLGLRVLRFTAPEISKDLEDTLEAIRHACRETVLSDNPQKQWQYAETLAVGDTVFWGVELCPCRIVALERQETIEEVYDLEVEETHSFLTEVCAVHNCGSGTTAHCAKKWGRRWITCDTSRVSLAIARQRLMTANSGPFTMEAIPVLALEDPTQVPIPQFEEEVTYKR